ncbi:MAG: hypothetical protein KJO23_02815 [Bacteroidia bacterium]|nr:hypothetical protein [Bacteroidia bacterium]NNM21930.1 hypothetical protein [Flavobacteriaceae bacterium]
MKTILSALLLFYSTLILSQTSSQSTIEGQNEIKINMGYAIAGLPEITYERVIDDGGAVGLSVAFAIDEDIDYSVIAIPYYRLYFGQKRAAGFFVEGNVGVFSEERNDNSSMEEMGFGPGLAVGGKFLTKTGWVAEIVGGAGRNFLNTDVISEVFPRLGVSIGKRF